MSVLALSTGAADPNAPERDAANRRERTAEGDRTAQGGAGQLDGQLAACLIIGNQKEIAVSRQAEQQLQNADVKKFAQQMVQDHEKFVKQLQQFAEQGGFQQSQLAIDGTARAESRDATTRPRTEQPRSTARQNPDAQNPEVPRSAARSEALDSRETSHQLIGIEREVAEQCVQSATKALSEKQGAEADRCYIGMQIGEHMGMVDKLEVFSRHASPELQAVLQQGLKTAQEHPDHAKQLAKQLEGEAKAGEQRPTREKKS
jgi:predicted outer membrane protein